MNREVFAVKASFNIIDIIITTIIIVIIIIPSNKKSHFLEWMFTSNKHLHVIRLNLQSEQCSLLKAQTRISWRSRISYEDYLDALKSLCRPSHLLRCNKLHLFFKTILCEWPSFAAVIHSPREKIARTISAIWTQWNVHSVFPLSAPGDTHRRR